MAGNYPDLIQPIVPDSQRNKSPEILLEGMRTGLAAAAQFAQMRRQQESDLAHLALQERLAQEQHQLERDKLEQAARLIPSQIEANQAHASLMTEQGIAYHENVATAAQIKKDADAQKRALFNEVQDTVKELKLDDVHFQTKEPMQFAANVIRFQQMYHLSPVPQVRKAIKDYQAIADTQKLYIRTGVEGEDGAIEPTGNGRQVPAWRIVMNAQDPLTREQTLRDLEASGYTEMVPNMRTATQPAKKAQHWWQRDLPAKQVTVHEKTRQLRAPVKQYMEEAQGMEPAAAPPTESAPAPEKVMPDYGPTGATVRVKSPNGAVGTIPIEQKESAIAQGYTVIE